MNNLFAQFFCDYNTNYSIVIEDNSRVAYAYLLLNKDIIGDVWLYNRLPAPKQVAWKRKQEMPFLNPIDYTKIESVITLIKTKEDIHIKWNMGTNEKDLVEVLIFVNDQCLAKIIPDAKPGWCVNAKKDGPLAKILSL